MTTMLGGCACYGKAPTVPTCRDRMAHLDDCPAKGSEFPVGAFVTTGLVEDFDARHAPQGG